MYALLLCTPFVCLAALEFTFHTSVGSYHVSVCQCVCAPHAVHSIWTNMCAPAAATGAALRLYACSTSLRSIHGLKRRQSQRWHLICRNFRPQMRVQRRRLRQLLLVCPMLQMRIRPHGPLHPSLQQRQKMRGEACLLSMCPLRGSQM